MARCRCLTWGRERLSGAVLAPAGWLCLHPMHSPQSSGGPSAAAGRHPPRLNRWFPWAGEVSATSLRADALAGLLGALLVLPQGIAFASLAGLPPQMGLAAAVLPALVAALAGSSRQVVTGPTNANSIALGAMLAPLALAGTPLYLQLALALTFMVGLLQFAVGALRLGALANFISPTALLGFTSGAAVLIAWHALPDALALPKPSAVTGAGWLQWLGAVQPGAFAVAATTVATGLVLRAWRPGWPGLLIALLVGSALAWVLEAGAGLAAIPKLGAVPVPWPQFAWPAEGLTHARELLGLAAALTVVALAQSMAIGQVVAARSGHRLDANREFVGQGLANLVGGCTQSLIACGSLNRSLPNLEAGARTPLAAVGAALLLVPMVALSAPMLALLPLAAMAGLLLLVAFSLFDFARWKRLARSSRSETAVAAITGVATLLLPLEQAVLVGSALSLGLYLHRTAHPAMRSMGFDRDGADRPFIVVEDTPGARPQCPQLKLLRMEGPVYFAATAHVSDRLQALRDERPSAPHLLVMSKSMNFLDPAGADLWLAELRTRRAQGGDLYFHRPRPPVLEQWRRDGFLDELGADHLFADKRSAIASICRRLDPERCARCHVRVFAECHDPSVVAPLREGLPPTSGGGLTRDPAAPLR